jgi:hypothetical protein
MAPEAFPRFVYQDGTPLAGGFLFTYAAGTNTNLNTYVDSLGTIQNTDPILLDSTGAPSNGSVRTGIWLANTSYKFCTFDVNMVQIGCADHITGYFGLLNLANTWTFGQSFTLPLTDLATDNQFTLGAPGNQTLLDFPPPAFSSIVLHFPSSADTVVGRNTTDTMTSKTLITPVITAPSINVLKNTTTVTQTGDTALHTIYTIPISAGAMGINNQLRITLLMGLNVVAGQPVVEVTYGSTVITPAVGINASAGNSNGVYAVIIGGNVGATNVQSWDTLNAGYLSGIPAGNQFHQTSAIDSTVIQNLTVTYQGGANSDSVTFYRLLVEIL